MNDARVAQQPSSASVARRSGRVFLAQVLFVGMLVAAVAGGLWTITRDQTRVAAAPGTLAGMPLQEVMTGEAALARMEGLHGKEVGLRDGWIAVYQHGGVLWVGEAESAAVAERLTARMTERIEDGNPMFRHLGIESIGRVAAHKVTDGSALHYYYQLGEKVVWITAPQESGHPFVEEAMAALSGS